jgi:hypothetical protein
MKIYKHYSINVFYISILVPETNNWKKTAAYSNADESLELEHWATIDTSQVNKNILILEHNFF